jgi:hypothetical protein
MAVARIGPVEFHPPPGARGDKILRVHTRTSLADEVIE